MNLMSGTLTIGSPPKYHVRIQGQPYSFKELEALPLEKLVAMRTSMAESEAYDAVCGYALLTAMIVEKRLSASPQTAD